MAQAIVIHALEVIGGRTCSTAMLLRLPPGIDGFGRDYLFAAITSM